jgi:glycerol-1-phosphate dehydrogenase [NAD(P)+]
MPEKLILQLIRGEYIFDGKAIHVPVKSVVIDSGVARNAGDLIEGCGLRGRALLVSDVNTHAALGGEIARRLGINDACSLIFENGVKADIANVEKIKKAAVSYDYIIAVGSGTINDLCKYSSFLLNKPYVVFGTAPSMNGYGSANASITISGHKKTLKAQLPVGMFFDLNVLVKAPLRLIRSGLGDSLCRSTAQADWLLSNLLLGTFYTELPFTLLECCEADLFANSKALVEGDVEVMRLLASTLVLSGFGMYLAGGSYPASQGEHMIAHTIEMMGGDSLLHSYHGEQIGVTTLMMARLQDEVCQLELVNYKNTVFPTNWKLSSEILKECNAEFAEKRFAEGKVDLINGTLSSRWDEIKSKVNNVTLPYSALRKILHGAGCPLDNMDIGWSGSLFEDATRYAKFSRNRFTFLDL